MTPLKPNDKVRYHHMMLGRTLHAVVTKTTKRGVTIEIMNAAEHGVSSTRSFTHHQAAGCLEQGWS